MNTCKCKLYGPVCELFEPSQLYLSSTKLVFAAAVSVTLYQLYLWDCVVRINIVQCFRDFQNVCVEKKIRYVVRRQGYN